MELDSQNFYGYAHVCGFAHCLDLLKRLAVQASVNSVVIHDNDYYRQLVSVIYELFSQKNGI